MASASPPENVSLRISLRPARPDDAPAMTALALRSKASWGYSSDFMQACVQELTVAPEDIDGHAHHHEVAVCDDTIVGFYTLEGQVDAVIELGALFVEPGHMGAGIGRRLLQAALARAQTLGARDLTIQGDPNADGFYRSAGAIRVGSRESGSVPGRMLPLYRIAMDAR